MLIKKISQRLRFEKNKLENFFTINNIKLSKKFKLNNQWEESYNQLKNNGVCFLPIKIKIPRELRDPNYFINTENYDDFIILKKKIPNFDQYGKSQIEINFNSKIFRLIFSDNLRKLIHNYYQKEFWLRNAPVLIIDKESERKINHDQNLFHLDHCERQLSIMILLNDLTVENSHTQYISGSNKKSWIFINDNRNCPKFKERVQNIKNNSNLINIVGRSGDVILFDAGNGLHKAVYGKDRAIIHLNFSQMRMYAKYNKNFEKEQRYQGSIHYKIFREQETKSFLDNENWISKYFKYLEE